MAAPRTEDTILVAKDSFWHSGGIVHAGTTVRVGHPLLEGRENLFSPLVVEYDVDEESAEKPVGRHAPKPAAK